MYNDIKNARYILAIKELIENKAVNITLHLYASVVGLHLQYMHFFWLPRSSGHPPKSCNNAENSTGNAIEKITLTRSSRHAGLCLNTKMIKWCTGGKMKDHITRI